MFLITVSLVLGCSSSVPPLSEESKVLKAYEQNSGPLAEHAMVVSAHPYASKVGIDILRKGGSAYDAAIAVHFALAVVYPAAGNLGGGGFMVSRDNNGDNYALDFREKAPAKAHRDMFLDENEEVIARSSLDSPLAVGVPGAVAGMWELHRRKGTLSWDELLKPSVRLAQDGFLPLPKQIDRLNYYQSFFENANPENEYLRENGTWSPGDTLIQKDLAQVLLLIKDKGKDGFYSGPTADKIVSQMKETGGFITKADLKNYKSLWRETISCEYRGYTVISMPPPSSGGIALCQLLGMLETFPLDSLGHNTPQTIHYLAEAERRVYADRANYLGDADFVEVPVNKLLTDKYIKERSRTINSFNATPSDSVSHGQVPFAESEATTHFSIVDSMGNAVSITTTLNSTYGSKIFVNGAGFLLNNEMDDFSIKPGVPNTYGLIGAEANAIAPGKRMLSSMTPTIVVREDELFMVVGTPGGSTIITSVLQVISNVVDHNMNMAAAVNAYRVHHQWRPDTLFVEADALDSLTSMRLGKMGHTLLVRKPIGRVDAILVHDDGMLEGGADIREEDTALGY